MTHQTRPPMFPPAKLVSKTRGPDGTQWVTTVDGESMSFERYCTTGGRPKDADTEKAHFWRFLEGGSGRKSTGRS